VSTLGVGIKTSGSIIGYGATMIDFRGSGISTVTNLNVYSGGVGINSIGLGTDKPAVDFDASNSTAYLSSLGLSTTALFNGATTLAVNGFSQLGSIGIGTTSLYDPNLDGTYGLIQIHGSEDFNSGTSLFGAQIFLDQFCSVGFNTYIPRSIFDFGRVGTAVTLGYIIPPTLTTVQRAAIGSTVSGGLIYNSNTTTPQYYNGTRWFDITTTDGNSANAGFSTFARWAGISTIASVAGFATNATRAGVSTLATYAYAAGIATVATQAGISTTVSGGIADVTVLQVAGVSTFTNGPIKVGTGVSISTGIVTATGGFASGINTAPTQIWVSGNRLIFNVVGIGSTSFLLS
jgi:hypothetical protein